MCLYILGPLKLIGLVESYEGQTGLREDIVCLHLFSHLFIRCRPYYHEYTGSLPNSEVKRGKARLVLGSGTAWEPLRVLTAFCWRQLHAPAHIRLSFIF